MTWHDSFMVAWGTSNKGEHYRVGNKLKPRVIEWRFRGTARLLPATRRPEPPTGRACIVVCPRWCVGTWQLAVGSWQMANGKWQQTGLIEA